MNAFPTDSTNSTGLLDQAVVHLQRKVQGKPDDVPTLRRLGDFQRMLGNLQQAKESYQCIASLNPGDEAAHSLIDILSGNPVRADFDRKLPASPYVLIPDWLSMSDQENLWNLLERRRSSFADSSIEGYGVNRSKRSSVSIDDLALGDELDWLLEKILQVLQQSWGRLGVREFTVVNREIQITNHRHGDFLNPHRDCSVSGPFQSRTVSFVYYLHRQPRKFSGGDFLLFDPEDESLPGKMTYTRIVPQSNRLLMFPSHCLHQVTQVNCESAGFLDSRLSIHGCLHRRML